MLRRTPGSPPKTGSARPAECPSRRATGPPTYRGPGGRSWHGSDAADVRPSCCQMDVQRDVVATWQEHVPAADGRNDCLQAKSPAVRGFLRCAREDSNLHGPYSPQGPQPCASTNSATGAGGGQYNPASVRPVACLAGSDRDWTPVFDRPPLALTAPWSGRAYRAQCRRACDRRGRA